MIFVPAKSPSDGTYEGTCCPSDISAAGRYRGGSGDFVVTKGGRGMISVPTQINNPGYNPNSKVTAIKNTSSESVSKITIYMTTYPKVPATDFDIYNNVLVWSFDIELTEQEQ